MRKTNVRNGGRQPLLSKGFTLIELLAVIVILAIIALIATPIVLGIINNAKEQSTKRSAELYIDAVEKAIVRKNQEGEYNPNQCKIKEGKVACDGKFDPSFCEIKDGQLNCDGVPLEVEIDGEVPEDGTIVFQNEKVISINLTIGGYIATLNREGEIALDPTGVIPTPVSFAEDSWDTIVKNVRAGNLSKYKVGDTKEISLTGFTNTAEEKGTYTVRIANTSTPKECATEGFSQTACGFVVEFVDIISEHNMNPADEYKGVQYSNGWNVDGYPSSSMYKFLNDTTDDTITSIYESLSEDLKYVIIDTKVISGHGKTAGETNFTSTDKLYILAPKEVYGIKNDYDTLDETRQLDYYNKKEVTTSNCPECVKKYNGSAIFWWLRSPISYTNFQFFGIMATGNFSHGNAKSAEGIVPAFRIG